MDAHAATVPGEEEVIHDDHHDDPVHIRKEIRTYLLVFAALTVLTGVTVWLAYGLQLPVHLAILIALAVASVKGFLVAGFFMHLLNERKFIYAVLGLTVFFFAVLMWGPWHHMYDSPGEAPPLNEQPAATATVHGSGH